jgi:hypothetical protein
MTSEDDALFGRYLVDDCSEDERTRVEDRFFTDSDAFERLCELEEELIGRYVRGDLDGTARGQFERAYSVAPRRDRLVMTLALGRVLGESAGPAQMESGASAGTSAAHSAEIPWWKRWLSLEPAGARLVLAAACAVLALGLLMEVRQSRAQRATLEQSRQDSAALRQQAEGAARRAAESERRIAALSEEVARAQGAAVDSKPSPPRTPVFATFVLTPGRTRSAREPVRIVPPANADRLRLQLNLDFDAAYASFKAELRTSAGDLLWSQERLSSRPTADGPSVVVTVPATLVPDGEYELELQGRLTGNSLEDATSYYFTVARPERVP